MKKKISRILIVLLYFTPCNIIVLIYILLAWGVANISEKTYYIPEIDSYMKIYKPGIYVAFGDSINFMLNDSVDYITLPRFGTIIYCNLNNKSFYVTGYDSISIKTGKIKKLDDKYGKYLDKILLEQYKREETTPDSKLSYIVLDISEYANYTSIWDFKHKKWIHIEPIEEKTYFNRESFNYQFSRLMFWKKDSDKKTFDNLEFLFNLDSDSQKK